MANIKISALPSASTLAGVDLFPVVQGGTTKKATAAQLGNAWVSAGPVSPTGTTSLTPGIMMGIGALITPVRTGIIFASVGGWITNNTAGQNAVSVLRIAAGASAPAYGVAATGSVFGSAAAIAGTTSVTSAPLSINGIGAGLTLGTQYWLDISLYVSGGSSTGTVSSVVLVAFEI